MNSNSENSTLRGGVPSLREVPVVPRRPTLGSRTIALLYFAFSSCWIFFTDRLVHGLGLSNAQLLHVSEAKGILFISLSTLLIYVLVEKTLRQRHSLEAAYWQLVETAQEGVWSVDAEGKTVFANENMAAILGTSRGEMIGKSILPFVPQEKKSELLNHLLQREQGLQERYEFPFLRADGAQVWTLLRASPVFRHGRHTGSLALVSDITERKRAEAALRESEERYRTLFEKANDAVLLENERDEIIEVNQRACALFGYSRDELLTMKVSDLQAPEVRGPAGRVVRELERHGSAPFETVDLHRGGRRIVVEVTNTPIVHQGETLVSEVLSIVRDITARKRAEDTLRQSEAYLAEAQRLSHTGSWALDVASGKYLYVSEEFCRIFGLVAQEGLPSREDFSRLIHPEDWDRANRSFEKQLREKADLTIEYRIALPNGAVKHLQAIRHPVLNEAGEVVKLVGTVIDMTERKRAEDTLRQSEAYLAEAQRLSHTGSWAFEVASDTYIYASEECGRIFEFDAQRGLPTREAISRLIHPKDWPRVNETFEKTLRDKVDTSSEFRIALPNGTAKHIQAIRHPVLNEAGEVVKLVGTVIDMTERKRAENELRASDAQLARERDRLRLLLEINNLIVSKLDVNELFRAVSQCMRKHFAHDCTTFWLINERSACLERKFFDFPTGRGFLEKVEIARPSNLESEWWRHRTPVFYSPVETDIPLPVREATRAESLISAVSLPLIGTNGPLGLMNLSSRKADAFEADADLLVQIGTQVSLVLDNALAYEGLRGSRDALRRSETYLAEAQRLTHTGSWVRDTNGNIAYLSDELYRIFGLDPQQGLPSRETLRRQVHPDDVERAVSSVENALRDKVDTFVEYRIVLPDGTVKHLQVIRHPVLDDAGHVVELVGTTLDVTDRKRDEEALRQSEAYLAESQRLSHTGSWALDVASNKNVYVSEECFRVFGFDSLPTGDAMLQRIHPEDRDRWRGNFDKALREKIDSFGEYRIVLPDGAVKHVHMIWHPVLDTSGNCIQCIGTAADVTERVRNEEALRRSETYLSETQKLAHTGTWVWDPIHRQFLYASEEMLRLYGFDPQEGIPTPDRVLERIHPDDRDKIKHTRTGKADVDFDYRFVLPDGTLKYFHCIAHPVTGPSGEVLETLGIAMDITERKQAEEALRESETRFRTFVDYAADAFFMLDIEQGIIIDVNRCACESLGYTRQELVGMNPMAFHLDSERSQMESVAKRAAAGETAVDTHRHLRKDGSRFPVEVHTSAFQYRGRRLLLKVARDISERIQAEEQREQLRQLEAELTHINRVSMMGELAASIAHEVGQPLSGVVSNGGACVRWLARDVPNLDEAREAARRIIRDGKRAGEIIARIRAMTKKAATPNEKLVLNETIQDVLALLGDEVKRKSTIIRTQFADGLAAIAGDRVQIQQVILNLVMNGIEAMGSVSERVRELVISTRNVEPDQVQVTVEDSGIGLDPTAMDRIFDPFYTTKPTGMGMGLSICRSILQAHGGRLWATAKDGPGTMFHFTLQRYQEGE